MIKHHNGARPEGFTKTPFVREYPDGKRELVDGKEHRWLERYYVPEIPLFEWVTGIIVFLIIIFPCGVFFLL